MNATRKILCLLLSGIGFAGSSYAADLGSLYLQSFQNQPFAAEITVDNLTSTDLENMQISLASEEQYRAANLNFDPALSNLRFVLQQAADKTVVKVSSSDVIQNPNITLLVNFKTSNANVFRKYSFLLDPLPVPVSVYEKINDTQAAQVNRDATLVNPSKKASRYLVKKGDTLSKIAQNLSYKNTNQHQQLLALFRANPQAFLGNMNRLQADVVLHIPAESEILSIDAGEANRLFALHASQFRSLQQTRMTRHSQTSSGVLTQNTKSTVETVAELRDQLKLSKTQSGQSNKQPTHSSETAQIAQQKAEQDQQKRKVQLAKNIEELKQALQQSAAKVSVNTSHTGAVTAQSAYSAVQADKGVDKKTEALHAGLDLPQPAENKAEPAHAAAQTLEHAQEVATAAATTGSTSTKAVHAAKATPESKALKAEHKQKMLTPFYKSYLFWSGIAGALVVVFGALFVLIRLKRKKQNATATDPVLSEAISNQVTEHATVTEAQTEEVAATTQQEETEVASAQTTADMDTDQAALEKPTELPPLDLVRAMKLNEIDLELPAQVSAIENTHAARTDDAKLDLNLPKLEEVLSEKNDIDTQLDLAVAYIEIGDHEGARELLDEILKNAKQAQQIERAQLLLASLNQEDDVPKENSPQANNPES